MTKWCWQALSQMLEDLIEGRAGLTEGCRAILNHVQRCGMTSNDLELWRPLVGFDSETDVFPLGEVRNLWAPESLKTMDQKREATEAYYREWVLEAARQLRDYAREQSR